MVRPVSTDRNPTTAAGKQSLANANKIAHMDQVKRHFEILGMDNPHARTHGMVRRSIASGGSASGPSYTGIRDMFDGGGPGRSGSRFFMRDTAAMDTTPDNYISEAEALAFQNKDEGAYNKAVGGIGSISNFSGARPRGSYAQERSLGPAGTNIGTSGIANYITGGGPLGALFGGKPNTMQRAQPQMDANQRFTYDNLRKFMTDQQAREFLGSNYSPPAPSMYGGDALYGSPSVYNPPPMNMNMGGIMQLANFGRSV